MGRLFWLQVPQKGDKVLIAVDEIAHNWTPDAKRLAGRATGQQADVVRQPKGNRKATGDKVDCGEQKTNQSLGFERENGGQRGSRRVGGVWLVM
jgi:hypothetical protein